MLLLYIIKKLADVHKVIEERIEIIKGFIDHPKSASETVGAVVAGAAVTHAQKLIKRAKDKK